MSETREQVRPDLPHLAGPVPGPNARAMIARDSAVISPSYTRAYPLAVQSGEGCMIDDVDGNRYLDFSAGIAVVAAGHCHPQVVAAIQEQAARLIHMSGTDFYYEEMGALSLTARKAVQRSGFAPLVPGVVHAPYPYCYRCAYGKEPDTCAVECVQFIENTLLKTVAPAEETAAIVIEPVQGEGGYIVPPRKFFDELTRVAQKHGILIIADEVQSGMGRTGKMWASEHFGLVPDILAVAKGIASGMPLGATVARASLMTWPPGAD